jgi:hypothetical protein
VGVTALATIVEWCRDAGVDWEQTGPRDIVVVLPGEQKLRTTVSVTVATDTITINAFVIRHPDENVDQVHRWLLERNRRIFAMGYAIDQYGDIFLVGTLPARDFDADVLDRLMGSVLLHADQAFNSLLELGFSTAIRAEWSWRLKTGESTANLAAFAHLAPPDAPSGSAE